MIFLLAATYGIGAAFLNDSLAFDNCWHIRGGSTLTTILDDPDTINAPAACGPFTAALPANDYDHLVLQVLADCADQIPVDVVAIETFRGMEPGAQVWVYENWAIPSLLDDWHTPLTPSDTSFRSWKKTYYEQVADLTNSMLIPSGDLIYGLRHVAGWTDDQIFRDIGGHTVRENVAPLLTELIHAIITPRYIDVNVNEAELIWSVIIAEARTGIRRGDADVDRDVDITDFNILVTNFGSTSATWSQGDFDLDQDVDITDFNTLAANFGHSSLAAPEPGYSFLAWLGVALMLTSRSSAIRCSSFAIRLTC